MKAHKNSIEDEELLEDDESSDISVVEEDFAARFLSDEEDDAMRSLVNAASELGNRLPNFDRHFMMQRFSRSSMGLEAMLPQSLAELSTAASENDFINEETSQTGTLRGRENGQRSKLRPPMRHRWGETSQPAATFEIYLKRMKERVEFISKFEPLCKSLSYFLRPSEKEHELKERSVHIITRMCNIYVKKGYVPPPRQLSEMIMIRSSRAKSRIQGLEALRGLCLSVSAQKSYVHAEILSLGLYGLASGGIFHRRHELHPPDLKSVANDALLHNHFLTGIEGCSASLRQGVRQAFLKLFGDVLVKWNEQTEIASNDGRLSMNSNDQSGNACSLSLTQNILTILGTTDWHENDIRDNSDQSFIFSMKDFVNLLHSKFSFDEMYARTIESTKELDEHVQLLLNTVAADLAKAAKKARAPLISEHNSKQQKRELKKEQQGRMEEYVLGKFHFLCLEESKKQETVAKAEASIDSKQMDSKSPGAPPSPVRLLKVEKETGKWVCDECEFPNEVTEIYCEMCSYERKGVLPANDADKVNAISDCIKVVVSCSAPQLNWWSWSSDAHVAWRNWDKECVRSMLLSGDLSKERLIYHCLTHPVVISLRALLKCAKVYDEEKKLWYDDDDGDVSFDEGLLQECYSYLRCMGFDLAKGQTEEPHVSSNWGQMITINEQSLLVDCVGAMRIYETVDKMYQDNSKYGVREFLKRTMKIELPNPGAFKPPIKPAKAPLSVLTQCYRLTLEHLTMALVGGGTIAKHHLEQDALRTYLKMCTGTAAEQESVNISQTNLEMTVNSGYDAYNYGNFSASQNNGENREHKRYVYSNVLKNMMVKAFIQDIYNFVEMQEKSMELDWNTVVGGHEIHLRESLLFLLSLIPSNDAIGRVFVPAEDQNGNSLAVQLVNALMKLVAAEIATDNRRCGLSTPENRRLASILLREIVARYHSKLQIFPSFTSRTSESTSPSPLRLFFDSLLLHIGRAYLPAQAPSNDTPGMSNSLCLLASNMVSIFKTFLMSPSFREMAQRCLDQTILRAEDLVKGKESKDGDSSSTVAQACAGALAIIGGHLETIHVGGTVRLEKSLPNAGSSGSGNVKISKTMSTGQNMEEQTSSSSPTLTATAMNTDDDSQRIGKYGRVISCDLSCGVAQVSFGGADDAAGGIVASTTEKHKIADLVAVSDPQFRLIKVILSKKTVGIIATLFSKIFDEKKTTETHTHQNEAIGSECKSSAKSAASSETRANDVQRDRLQISILSCLACRAAVVMTENNPDFTLKLSLSGEVRHLVHNAMLPANVSSFVSYHHTERRVRCLLDQCVEIISFSKEIPQHAANALYNVDHNLRYSQPFEDKSKNGAQQDKESEQAKLEKRRREELEKAAKELSAMGPVFGEDWPVDLCLKALKSNGSSKDHAVSWLMSPEGRAYVNSGVLQRLRKQKEENALKGKVESPEEIQLREHIASLEEISRCTPWLCERVLEFFDYSNNVSKDAVVGKASEWLMSQPGKRWMEFEAKRERNEKHQKLTGANSYHDSAVVEDISTFSPDSLMLNSSSIANGEAAASALADGLIDISSSNETSATLLASADGKKGQTSGNVSKPEIRFLRQRWGAHAARLAKFPDCLDGESMVTPDDIVGMRVVRGLDLEGDITSIQGKIGVIIKRLPNKRPMRYGISPEQIRQEELELAKKQSQPAPPTKNETHLMEVCALKSVAFARHVLNRFNSIEASVDYCTSNTDAEIEYIALHPEQNNSTSKPDLDSSELSYLEDDAGKSLTADEPKLSDDPRERRWQQNRLRLQGSQKLPNRTRSASDIMRALHPPHHKYTASPEKTDYPRKFKEGERVAVYFKLPHLADGGKQYEGTITHVGLNPDVFSYQYSSVQAGSMRRDDWVDFDSRANKYLSQFPAETETIVNLSAPHIQSNHTYAIDFQRMVQTNQSTNTQRKIRRNPKGGGITVNFDDGEVRQYCGWDLWNKLQLQGPSTELNSCSIRWQDEVTGVVWEEDNVKFTELRYFTKQFDSTIKCVDDLCEACVTALETLTVMACRLALVNLLSVKNANNLLKESMEPSEYLPLLPSTLETLESQRSVFRNLETGGKKADANIMSEAGSIQSSSKTSKQSSKQNDEALESTELSTTEAEPQATVSSPPSLDEASISSMIAMGFMREDSMIALYVCNNDTNAAIEYLFDKDRQDPQVEQQARVALCLVVETDAIPPSPPDAPAISAAVSMEPPSTFTALEASDNEATSSDDEGLLAALAASKTSSEMERECKISTSSDLDASVIKEEHDENDHQSEQFISPCDSEAAASACAFVQLVKYIGSWEHAFAESSPLKSYNTSQNAASSSKADKEGRSEDTSSSSLMQSLRRSLATILGNEASATISVTKEIEQSSHDVDKNLMENRPMSRILVEECTTHLLRATEQQTSGDAQQFESLHPYFPESAYRGMAKFENSKALRVTFDPRSSTLKGSASLTFFSDPDYKVELLKFSGSNKNASGSTSSGPERSTNWKPFIVESNVVYFEFRSHHRIRSNDSDWGMDLVAHWGYKFFVKPISGLQWSTEIEILKDSSLEWACWLLNFLLNEGIDIDQSVSAAVHTIDVYDALVKYLRYPGVPYKDLVINLITQMLSSPHLFERGEYEPVEGVRKGLRDRSVPKLHDLEGVWKLTQQCLKSENGKKGQVSRLLFPPRLQALMKLEIERRSADKYFKRDRLADQGQTSDSILEIKSNDFGESKSTLVADTNNPGDQNIFFDDMDEAQQLENVITFAEALQSDSMRISDICSFDKSLLDMAMFQVIMHRCFESPHDLNSIPSHKGSCTFENRCNKTQDTKILVIYFDGRCNIPKDAKFELFYLSRTGDEDTWQKINLTPGKSFTVSTDRLKWEYTCGTRLTKLDKAYGYRFTVRPLRPRLLSFGINKDANDTVLRTEVLSNMFEADATSKTNPWRPYLGSYDISDFDPNKEATREDYLRHSDNDGTEAAEELKHAMKIAVTPDKELDIELIAWLNAHVFASRRRFKKSQNQNDHDEPVDLNEMSKSLRAFSVAPEELFGSLDVNVSSNGCFKAEHHNPSFCGDDYPRLHKLLTSADASSHSRKKRSASYLSFVDQNAQKNSHMNKTALSPTARGIALRLAILQEFNWRLWVVLHTINLCDTAVGKRKSNGGVSQESQSFSAADTIRMCAPLVCSDLKHRAFFAALHATASDRKYASRTGVRFNRIVIDRKLASKTVSTNDPARSRCVFVQLFKAIHSWSPRTLRYVERRWMMRHGEGGPFAFKFAGEDGIDAGGLFNEVFNLAVEDLFQTPKANSVLCLFHECPNMRTKSGDSGTDKFLPNPSMIAPLHISMFEFVGKLIGLSMRIGGNFPFDLPSLVYKALCGELPTRQDVLETDEKTYGFLCKLEKCKDEKEFNNLWRGLRYVMTSASYAGEAADVVAAWQGNNHESTVVGSKLTGTVNKSEDSSGNGNEISDIPSSGHVADLRDDQLRAGIVELYPGGSSRSVTFSDKQNYVNLAFEYRLHEFDRQLNAIRRGFNTVVPDRALQLFTAKEVDELVSGSSIIDLDILRSHTRYSGGYREGDAVIKNFWRAMNSFTNEERIKFVKFAWGRSRLPRQWEGSSLVITRGSASLPIAHTCFFQVELPAYRTYEMLRKRLLVAIVYGLGSMDGID